MTRPEVDPSIPTAAELRRDVLNRDKYAAWIEAWVSAQSNRFVRGKCAAATEAMVAAFPELRRVAGFVHCTWGRDQHWWCVTPGGDVIDPTAEQFAAVFEYEELDLDDPADRERIPTGRCMDCGGDAYEGKSFCSDACEESTRAYMNEGRGSPITRSSRCPDHAFADSDDGVLARHPFDLGGES